MTHIVGRMALKLAVLPRDQKLQLRMVTDVLEYILESEVEDFDENPSEAHVYFKAYAAIYGMISADEMLRETIEQNGEE